MHARLITFFLLHFSVQHCPALWRHKTCIPARQIRGGFPSQLTVVSSQPPLHVITISARHQHNYSKVRTRRTRLSFLTEKDLLFWSKPTVIHKWLSHGRLDNAFEVSIALVEYQSSLGKSFNVSEQRLSEIVTWRMVVLMLILLI